MVRRLPVIQATPDPEDAIARPTWRWVLMGAGLALALWAALVALVLPIGARWGARVGPAAAAPLLLLSFAASVGAASYVVVRFGPGATARRGAAVGMAATAIAWSFAAASGALGSGMVSILALAFLALVGGASGLFAGRIAARHARSGSGGV